MIVPKQTVSTFTNLSLVIGPVADCYKQCHNHFGVNVSTPSFKKQHKHFSSKVSKNLDKHIKQYFMDDFDIFENISDVPTVTTIPISQLNYTLLSGNKDFMKLMANFSKPYMFIQLERRNI